MPAFHLNAALMEKDKYMFISQRRLINGLVFDHIFVSQVPVFFDLLFFYRLHKLVSLAIYKPD